MSFSRCSIYSRPWFDYLSESNKPGWRRSLIFGYPRQSRLGARIYRLQCMKPGFFSQWSTGLLAILLSFSGWSVPTDPAPPSDSSAGTTSDEAFAAPVVTQDEAGADDIANAPATVALSQVAVPSNINLTPAASEVVKLVNSGVGQDVMLSYVRNSTSTFNLGADEIVYLKDIGVPGEVLTSMIQHDEELRGQPATVASPTTPPLASAPPPAPVVEPEPQVQAPVETPLTPPAAEPAYSTFYSSLAPYGTWINVAGYGLCWQPTVVVANPGWSPYWDCGHWLYTDLGWYWYSDYSWGWAPFHYGRWFRHAHFGWCWAPDTVWGPSWVSWRYNDAYCGWAPLGPGVYFSVGVGLSFGHHWWHDWDRPWNHHFVAWGDFRDHDLHHHGVGRHEVTQIFNRTVVENRVSVYNHVTINQGIARDRVMAATHTEVRPIAVRETRNLRSLGGRAEQLDPAGRRLTVYRPHISETVRSGGPNFAPGREVRPARNGVPTSIGQRDATPRTVPDRPLGGIARGESATSGITRAGGNAPVFRQAPSPASRTPSQPTIPQMNPRAVSSLTRPTEPVPRNKAQSLSRFEVRNPGATSPRHFTPSAPAPAQNYQTLPRTAPLASGYGARNEAPVARQARTPIYQPTGRTAPVARNYKPVPRQYSALTSPSQTRTPSVAPRYNAPVRQYSAPTYPSPMYRAPTRSAPEVPRYNSSSSYAPQHFYASAPLRSAPQTRYNSAPTHMPQHSYSPPSSQYRSPLMASPHFSAPSSSASSRYSRSGSGSAPSGGFSAPSHGSDHGAGRK